MSEELKLITRLLSRVRRRRGHVAYTSASNGNRRVVVKGWFDLDAGTMNGFTAFLLYDNDETQALVRANRVDAHGNTPDEALLNLAEILKEKHGNET